MGEVLVNALRGERGFFVNPRSLDPASPRSHAQPDCIFLCLPELIEPPRGAHANLDRVGFEIVVLGLPRVESHGQGDVANFFDLIDAAGFGKRTASGVVTDELMAAKRVERVSQSTRWRI